MNNICFIAVEIQNGIEQPVTDFKQKVFHQFIFHQFNFNKLDTSLPPLWNNLKITARDLLERPEVSVTEINELEREYSEKFDMEFILFKGTAQNF